MTNKEHYQKYKESCQKNKREYYYRNKDKILARLKANYSPDKSHAQKIKRMYGLSIDDYNRLLEEQAYKCAICLREKYHKRRFTVDHCHKTGKIRGLLCLKCNAMLGQAEDSITTLQAGIKYLSLTGTLAE
jgi:hypothetical protein